MQLNWLRVFALSAIGGMLGGTAGFADCINSPTLIAPHSRATWVEGGLVYDTTSGQLKTCDGTNFNTVAGSGGLAASDRISTTNVASGANLGMVVASNGTVSFTTGGVEGTAYLDTTGRYIGPGVSITTLHGVSSTNGYFFRECRDWDEWAGEHALPISGSVTKFDFVNNGDSLSMPLLSAGGGALLLQRLSTRWGLYIDNGGQLSIGKPGNSMYAYFSGSNGTFTNNSANVSGYAGALTQITYGFNGDVDSGMYRLGANKIGLVTSATDRLTIDSSGNVGIGTSAPTQLVDIVGGYTLSRNGFGLYNGGGLQNYNAGGGFVFNSDASIDVRTNSNVTYMRFANGNVGIGTTTPSSTLHVAGTARITSWTSIAANVTPTAELDVYGKVSATSLTVNGVAITGGLGASCGGNADKNIWTTGGGSCGSSISLYQCRNGASTLVSSWGDGTGCSTGGGGP